jgi:beta-lactamase class A
MSTRLWKLVVTIVVLVQSASSASAQLSIEPSPALAELAQTGVRAATERFPDEKIKTDDVAVTILDLREAQHLTGGSVRGDAAIFPASVVKLFYLVAAQQWLQDGKLQDSDELRRAMHDMIVDSSNDATGFFVDSLTDAPNGPPLREDQMKQWAEKRNAVNRYFTSVGFTGINVCQKTYCEGPFGRERMFLGPKYENRNKLTTDATARLLAEIVLGRAVQNNADRCKQMMELLKRDWTTKPDADNPDDQAHGFSALASFPDGTKLWSKAGWTSTARHDATYLELPDGRRLIVVTFTTGHARNRQIIPTIVKTVLAGVK